MAIAAVPGYLPSDHFASASPGMRFSYFLGIWTTREDQEGILRKRSQARSQEAELLRQDLEQRGMESVLQDWLARNRLPGLWQKNEDAARAAWQGILKLNPTDQATIAALATRQAALAWTLQAGGALLRLEARSVAPFATGLGNEHPLENGFAFLNPYGLPYLPGSGVKGVLRQAAHELARGEWGDSKGWSEETLFTLKIDKKIIPLSPIDVLFGRKGEDGDTEHVRGALTFWDVFPRIKGNSLQVEVMTPHQTHYYQGSPGATPHESGSPNPINFLTVPSGSDFTFHIQCDRPFLARLAPDLVQDDRWKPLMDAAFAHAFAWLGFGAKTAVGYGVMESLTSRVGPTHAAGSSAVASPANPQVEWVGVEIRYNPGSGELTVTHQGKSASLRNPDAQRLRDRLPEDLHGRLKKQRALKNCTVCVEPIGNAWRLVAIRAVGGVALAEVSP